MFDYDIFYFEFLINIGCMRFINLFVLKCLMLFQLISLNAQTNKILFSQDLKVKSDSTIHYGKLLLYDDFSSEWIVSTKSNEISKKDSLRDNLRKISLKSDVFTKYWSNTRLFPYPKQDLHNMIDSVEINLSKNSGFHLPPNDHIFSPFGWRRNRQHKGIDLDLNIGDTLRSAFSGKVRFADFNNGGYGNLVIVRHFNGLETYYAHLDKIIIQPNDIVLAGDVIGLGGETGNALGPHLHFEVRYKDVAFDSQNIIDYDKGLLKSSTINNNSLIYYLTKSDFSWVAVNNKKAAANNKKKYHKLKSGDYIGKLAVKYNTTVKKILKLNPKLKNLNSLQIGQVIRVR